MYNSLERERETETETEGGRGEGARTFILHKVTHLRTAFTELRVKSSDLPQSRIIP